ncbi:hypothetical protein CMI47_06320 [Candidatus Pacearchaeota archaeon]|nr:hypothetical protein [Candidatus Pacearchaeota archaeon]
MDRNWYTQREWDRTVGWGKVPRKYAKPESETDAMTIEQNTIADYHMFFQYMKGWDAYQSGDFATALREFRPLAEQGLADAQCYLGAMYENGLGLPRDYKAVIKWYTLAAEQENALAQNKLGLMYQYGRGVPQDYKTAVKWYRLAAEQGNADAQYSLGLMYHEGLGLPQDYKAATKWYTLAAETERDIEQSSDYINAK